jgi:hypothetical protein
MVNVYVLVRVNVPTCPFLNQPMKCRQNAKNKTHYQEEHSNLNHNKNQLL